MTTTEITRAVTTREEGAEVELGWGVHRWLQLCPVLLHGGASEENKAICKTAALAVIFCFFQVRLKYMMFS